MGGNHKKNLRAEKAKVKLKGAKLPKGLNVTKTEFKVRKIVIRDQTRDAGSTTSVDGQRQFNVKELLSRLKHHSSNFRLEALRKLREAILCGDVVGQPSGNLHAHLADIIQSVVAIALDMDKETRRESYKTLNCLLGILTTQAIAPFFHIISSYLRCAMTHIQPQLQEDSLLLLDVLLEHTPDLVATHSAKIFQNFLEMISRVRAEGGRSGARALTMQMSQQQTTIKWRFKVLLRLQKMLQTLAEQKFTINNARTTTTQTTPTVPMRMFNVKEPQYYAVKRGQPLQAHLDLSVLFSRAITSDENQTGGGGGGGNMATDEAVILRSYVEHLIPLLMDAWLEMRPIQASGGGSVNVGAQLLLSQDAASTLDVVLQIIECLWRLVALHEAQVNNNELSDWLRKTYANAMAENFLQPGLFPYQQRELLVQNKRKRKSTSNDPASSDTLCLSQNIAVSYLVCCFCAHENVARFAPKFDLLLEYLNAILANPRVYGIEQHLPLVPALRSFLLDNAIPLMPQYDTQLRRLLAATIKALLNNQFAGSVRDNNNENSSNNNNNFTSVSAKVLVLLCDIVKNRQLYDAYGAADFNDLLKHLPLLLLRPRISESAVLAMSQLGKQKNAVFLQALEEQLEAIIKHIQKIQVVGASNVYEGKKGIMNLFYWTAHSWRQTAAREQQLVNTVDEHVIDKRIASYYKWILTQG